MAKGDSMTIPWKAFQDEALDCLRALIRLDTTNPPGNERIAADYIADALAVHGVESVIRESAPTRASLIARHPGTDSSKGALLLSSHTDVVPVERSGWTAEPFSGEIADGCVWGRGAIDMKSKCATDLVLMTALKRAGAKPDRDVIMAAVADEEAGSDYGAKFLVERHPELVRASYVLNEVGGFTIHLRNRRFYPIQIAEKGFVTIKMKVTAMPGHGSMPRSDTAISRIAELITKILKTPMRKNVSPFMRETLEELGVPVDSARTLVLSNLPNTVSSTVLCGGCQGQRI